MLLSFIYFNFYLFYFFIQVTNRLLNVGKGVLLTNISEYIREFNGTVYAVKNIFLKFKENTVVGNIEMLKTLI